MEESTAKKIFIFTCIAFFSFGILWASIGPLLSEFAENNGSSLSAIGGIFSAIFIGAVVSQISLGPFTDRIGQLRMLTISLLTISLAMVGVSLSRWLPLTLFLAFIAGLGQGTTNLCGNVLIGQIFPKNSVSRVNLLNVFWGIGATIGPMLVSASITLWKTGFAALYVSAILIIVSSTVLIVRFFKVKITPQTQASGTQQKGVKISAFLWSMGIIGVFYVGAENSMSGWATTYIQQTTSVKLELAALVSALFWMSVTVSRAIGTVLGSRLKPEKILTLCLSTAVLGAVFFVVGYGSGVLSIIAIALIGMGLGAFYPTSIALVTQTFSDAPGKAGTLFTLMGSLGGAFIPWLQGVVMEQAGIQSGTYMVGALILLLLGSFILMQRQQKKQNRKLLEG